MFWVISVYFNIRNTLPKSGTFLLGHPVYIYIYVYIYRYIYTYIYIYILSRKFKVIEINVYNMFSEWTGTDYQTLL